MGDIMLLVILIAVSLSMDAFSLALAYGMFNFNKKEIITLSLIVGLYHLIMPFLGYNFGNVIFGYISIKPSLIVAIIFNIIGLEMIIDIFKREEKKKITGFIEMLAFGLAVSIDSFSTGIGIKTITNNIYFAFFCFSLTSFIFTFLGLKLGKKISDKIGKMSNLVGAIILILIGTSYFFK